MFYYSSPSCCRRGEEVMSQERRNLPDEPVPERVWRQLSHSTSLDRLEPHPVHWLSPGRLAAGKLTILDGDPGLGKSTLLCEVAASISRGEALPGGQPAPPRRVLLLSAEDDLVDTIRPRIDAAGGDPRRIVALRAFPYGTEAGRPFVIPGDVPLFEGLVQHLTPALIIIDPLVAYLDRAHNATSDQAVRRALAALTALGASTGVAIVAVRHLNKTRGATPSIAVEAALASSAPPAVVCSSLVTPTIRIAASSPRPK